jgi:hypothetical protein
MLYHRLVKVCCALLVHLEHSPPKKYIILTTLLYIGLLPLKFVHQGVVLDGMQRLKTGVLAHLMTRDIRDRRGWLVYIDLKAESVNVTHVRREQTSENTKDKNINDHFEVEWELRNEFDGKMTELKVKMYLEGTFLPKLMN